MVSPLGGLIAGGSALASLFGGKDKDTVRLEDLFSPAQREAQNSLLQFGQTGRIGDFQAGGAFNGSFGDFTPTGIESSGLQALASNLNAGNSQAFTDAQDTFTRLANPSFDPDNPSSGFAAFARQVARATGDANDVLNREAAITGNRFNSRLLQEKGDLQARQSDALQTELARLFESAQNRSLAGAQGLSGLAALGENINQSRIGQALDFGGLERQLRTQEAQAKYNDFLRQRQERLGSVNALSSVLSKDTPLGQTSLTTSTPSALSQLGQFGLGTLAERGAFDKLFGI